MSNNKKVFLNQKRKTTIIVVVALIAVYFSAIISTMGAFGTTVLPNQIGSIILAAVIMSKDLYRMTSIRFFMNMNKSLFFYGTLAFTLIVPHTAKTHMVMEEIDNGHVFNGALYLVAPLIAFFIISVLVITSIKKIKPKKYWVQIHYIIWALVPFLIVHFITIYQNSFYLSTIDPVNHVVKYDAWLFVGVYVIVALTPVVGLFTKSSEKFKTTYIRQIITMIIATLLIAIFYQYGVFLVMFISFIIGIIPLLFILYLHFRKNYNINIKLYLLSGIYALLFVIVPLFI